MRQQKVTINYVQQYEHVRRKSLNLASLPDRADLLLVCRRQFAVGHPGQIIKTTGVHNSIAVSFFEKGKKLGALAHFDLGTDVAASFARVIIPALRARSFNLKNTQVQLIGGLGPLFDRLRDQIRAQLLQPGQRVRVIEVELNKVGRSGLALETATGKMRELVRPLKTDGGTDRSYEQELLRLLGKQTLLMEVSQ